MKESIKALYIEFIQKYLVCDTEGILKKFSPIGGISESFPGWDLLRGEEEIRSGYNHIFKNIQDFHIEVPKENFSVDIVNPHFAIINSIEIVVTQVVDKVFVSRIHSQTTVAPFNNEWFIQSRCGNSLFMKEYSVSEWQENSTDYMKEAREAS